MALKFSLMADDADDDVVAPVAVVVGEFCECFGDDVAKNLGLAPLKSDFDRTWTPPPPPKMLLSCDAGDFGVVDLVVLVDNDDTLGL